MSNDVLMHKIFSSNVQQRAYSGSGVLFVNENETETKRKRNENAPLTGFSKRVLSFFETF